MAQTNVTARKWWDLGQHEYTSYAQANQKRLEMRDLGHIVRVKRRLRARVEIFVVQVYC